MPTASKKISHISLYGTCRTVLKYPRLVVNVKFVPDLRSTTMFTTAVVVLALVAVLEVDAERMLCKVVKLESSEGMCCTFPKNFSVNEIRNSLLESVDVLFPEDKNEKNVPATRLKDIVFPPSEKKEVPSDEMMKSSSNSSSIMIHFPGETQKNKTTGGKTKVTVGTRNKNDTPETCPEGELMDPNGDCVEPF